MIFFTQIMKPKLLGQNKTNVNGIYNTYPLSDLINLSVQKVQVLVKVLVLEKTLPDHL